MKKEQGFWRDLESYTWKIIGRLSPTLPWLGIGIIVLAITASAFELKASIVGTSGLADAAERAAAVGDYALARSLYEKQYKQEDDEQIMGVGSEVEELIFPEREVEREIAQYQELLTKYPGHRDICLVLAQLYVQIGEKEQAQDYLEMAKELDPNNAYFGQ